MAVPPRFRPVIIGKSAQYPQVRPQTCPRANRWLYVRRMSHGVALLLLSLLVFQVKHYVCDFVLQTSDMSRKKGIYGHRAGIIHAGTHVIGSVPAILILSRSASLVASIMAVEFLVHYHVDWLKLQFDHRRGLSIDRHLYWVIFGADQLIHQITYVAILAVLAQAAQL
jgi:Protein of unknown function (DUF3307)